MNKKLIAIIVIIVVLLLGIVGFLVSKSVKPKPKTQVVTPSPTPSPVVPSSTTKDYSDEAGFTFSHPDDLSLNKKDTTDKNTYAEIELSNEAVEGKIIISAVDTKEKTLALWRKKNLPEASPEAVLLAEMKGETFTQDDKLLYTVAIDQGVMFSIITEYTKATKNYWTKAHEQVVKSFTFAAPELTTEGSSSAAEPVDSSSDSSVEFEGEEVIE